MRGTVAAVVAVIAAGCHSRDQPPPAPIVEHPAARRLRRRPRARSGSARRV